MRILPSIILILAVAGVPAQAVPAQPAAAKPATANQQRPGASPAEAILDLAPWLAEQSAALAIKSRTYDPFGKRKDPSMKVPETHPIPPISQEEEPREPAVDLKMAFAKAVAAIKVTMIGSGQFSLAGGTTLNQGQTFKLTSEGQVFKTKVVKIASTGIILEDTANGHRATIAGSAAVDLPAGMQRGTQPSMPLAPRN